MTRRLTQSLVLLLLAAAVPACGKYGPPQRLPVAAPAAGEPGAPSATGSSSATPPVEAAPEGESCEEEPGKAATP